MKSLLFTVFIILINLVSYAQKEVIFPKEFPSELIGTKICGELSTSGKMISGGTAFLKLPIEVYVSKDLGIYARYNPGENWHEDKWGETQKIKQFILWKTIPRTDQYGDLIGMEYHYKVPEQRGDHYISALSILDYYGYETLPARKSFYLEIMVPSYDNALFGSNYTSVHNCGILKTQSEIEKEQGERIKMELQRKKEEEIQKKIEEEKRQKEELLKKDQDLLLTKKIDSLILINKYEDAALAYDKLNFNNSIVRDKIQQLLDIKYKNDTIQLNEIDVKKYINYHTKAKNNQLLSLAVGSYKFCFDEFGQAPNNMFPSLDFKNSNVNEPSNKIGSFQIKTPCFFILNITQKDSVITGSVYNSSYPEKLYYDKKDHFYKKTRTGLPGLNFAYNIALPKKYVQVTTLFKNEKYINGILVNTYNFQTIKLVKILKKD